MNYVYLDNPKIGNGANVGYRHAILLDLDGPMMETIERNSGPCPAFIFSIREWLRENVTHYYCYPYQGLVAFKNKEDCMIFKMVWG